MSVDSHTACLPPVTKRGRRDQGLPSQVTCASQVHVLEQLPNSVLKDQYFPP